MTPPDPAASPATQSPKGVQKRSPRTIAAAVGGGLLAIFAVVNLQTVRIHWVVGSSQTPLIVLILVCGAIGFGAGWLVARQRASRAKS